MIATDYQSFIQSKSAKLAASGIEVSNEELNINLFPFQRDLVKLALKAGRFCIWSNTGTGKSIMSLSWADALISTYNAKRILVLAPLGVAKQTVGEGTKWGIKVKYCADNSQVVDGINITNYDRLEKFDTSQFEAVILDESSCLKDVSSSTRNYIIDAFRNTPYKLACSATPAPNDYMELGNQCEFLGVMSYNEMLSMYFVHDGGETSKWRLKKHAHDAFWKFVCSWAVMLRMPSDLGYSDEGYILPPLQFHSHKVDTHVAPKEGELFFTDTNSLTGQRYIRKTSLEDRCVVTADLANDSDEQWLIWCETNDESALLKKLIPDAVEVKGADSPDYKENSAAGFASGEIRVLISKPSIFGMGLNFQSCHNVIYVGLSHSYELFFQSVRRVWRYGQTSNVNVHIIQHELEGAIEINLKRKERESIQMGEQMVKHMKAYSLEKLKGVQRQSVEYNPTQVMMLPSWLKVS